MALAPEKWTTQRAAFQARLEDALRRVRGTRIQLALLYIDLDRIGQVNHAWGLEWGDRVLREAAARIAQVLAPRAVPERLGADDFAAVVELADLASAGLLAGAVLERCRQPYIVDCLSLTVTASIGIGMYPTHARSAAALLAYAEHALYRAKIAGRDCFYPGGAPG